jgi:2-aminoadipate transaminase
MSDVFTDKFAEDVPGPAPRFSGLPRYNFVYGHIDAAKVPAEDLARAAAAVSRREGKSLGLYYVGHGPQGYLPLREFVAWKVQRRGISTDVADILLTTGSLQAIDLVNQILVQPGDTVIMEAFTFGLALSRARRRGATVVAAPTDHYGLDVDALEAILADLRQKGVRPKYIYTIPTVNNPTGTVLGIDRRHRLMELSQTFDVPLIEDECYADLHWGDKTPPSLYSLDRTRVVHIGSFSKTLAPALRIGYAIADWSIVSRMIATKSDAGSAGLDQMVAAEYLYSHFDTHLSEIKSGLQRKLAVMLEAVDKEFGTTVEVRPPEGGILLWLRFPNHVDVRTIHAAAAAEGVAFNAGSDWACDPEAAKHYIRLCYALPNEDDIQKGVRILANVMHRHFGFPIRSANRLRS